MTISAPISRTARVGIGETTPPSINARPFSSITGTNTPGIAQLARMASARSPSSFKTISSPVSRSQTTLANGIGRSSKRFTGKLSFMNFAIGAFDSSPRGEYEKPATPNQLIFFPIAMISAAERPDANAPPTKDPADVPATRSIGMSLSASAFSTPT